MRIRTMLTGLLISTATVGAGHVDFDLQDKLNGMAATEPISVLMYLEQVDLDGLVFDLNREGASRQTRHAEVVYALQNMADGSQPQVIADLEARIIAGGVDSFDSYWVANCIHVNTTAGQVDSLATIPGVETIYFNYPIELIAPVDSLDPRNDAAFNPFGTPEIGLVAINADDCWAAGYDGTGILVANLDTGVQGNHEALESRWAGLRPEYAGHPEWAWLDYNAGSATPWDHAWHGTHTMGTICGGSPGDPVGVAPGAHWMAGGGLDAGSIADTVAGNILVFQWMVDPDGDPSTVWDVPAVVGNSWGVTTGHGYPDCDTTFWTHLDAMHAAGTVIIFAAGNEGSGATTLRRPGDRATNDYTTHAVAAVDAAIAGWPIAGFSSRGPTFCTPGGGAAIKPDISAPGVDVRSAWSNGGYGNSGGTSMAAPHVAGVVALILQACPDLTPEEVHTIIFDTAFDLGPAGEDNDYGNGMIDAWAAVQAALAMCGGGGGDIDCVCDGEFSEGDRVHATVDSPSNSNGLLTGHCGTVICGSDGNPPLMIEWDDWYNGHDNTASCDCGGDQSSGTLSCWYVQCDEIALGCVSSTCDDGFVCGDSDIEDFLCGDSCYCLWTTSGDTECCFVEPDAPCTDFDVCATAADCPTGYACILSCCADPLCVPLCGGEPPVTGACCIGNVCSVVTEGECDDSGGVYMGDAVPCDADTCSCDGDLGPCPEDITGDGLVNVSDLLALLDHWGEMGPPRPTGDVNGDCVVNVADLLALIDAWGPCAGSGSVDCACDAQYNVGDRVHAAVDNPQGATGILAGHCGTVLCGRDGGDDLNILIEWDDWFSGHDNTSYCECGDGDSAGTSSCYWVDCPDIAAGCGGGSGCGVGFVCDSGDPVPWCDEPSGCYCGSGYDGSTYCVTDGGCSTFTPCPTGDCPAGFTCIVDTCCATPICMTECDGTPNPVPPGSGPTSLDRTPSSSGPTVTGASVTPWH